MIGIFDSGSGGLTFLAAMKRRYPDWSYVYYADYEHCPFWERSPEEIQTLTIAGVQKLFDAGAEIVILACNTASAWTLRKIQTEVFPDKKVLGVTIPWAEKVIELWCKRVTVFATEQTVRSRTYAERVGILDKDVRVEEIALSWNLVRAIEDLLPVRQCQSEEDFQKLLALYNADWWNCDDDRWQLLVEQYFWEFKKSRASEAIILGCTHYAYLGKLLQRLFSESILIDPSEESAQKLWEYLLSKPNLFQKIDKTGKIKFL